MPNVPARNQFAGVYDVSTISVYDLVNDNGFIVASRTEFGGLEIEGIFLLADIGDRETTRTEAIKYMDHLNHDRHKPSLIVVNGGKSFCPAAHPRISPLRVIK